MNPLELFQDPEVTDVLIDSTRKLQVIRSSKLETQEAIFYDESELQKFAKTVIRDAGGRIDLAKPYSDVSIGGQFGRLRFHAVLGNEISTGTQVSIRRHPLVQLTLEDLVNSESISQLQCRQLKQMLIDRENFVIVGATGSGKTTLLRAMLNCVDGERIISIEDNRELQIANAIELFTRPANPEGSGEISLEMLLREALRMRPDRLVIGEARGREIFTLLQAMNTGHNGVGFTLHADNPDQAISRMLGLLNTSGVDAIFSKNLISSSIKFLIQLDGAGRKVNSIEKLSLT